MCRRFSSKSRVHPSVFTVYSDLRGIVNQPPSSAPDAAQSAPDATTLNFFQSGPLPCPYLPERNERRLLVKISPELTRLGLFDQLTRSGFRRSHNFLYRPSCGSCSACIAVRIPVDAFSPSRTMKRIAKANSDLTVAMVANEATPEHFQLFQTYQRARHRHGDMETMDFRDYRGLIENSPADTALAELRYADGRLAGVCLLDATDDGLSAVYSFFDPGVPERSLGTYIVLSVIEQARRLDRAYLYLGYWIEACRKMAYKVRFRPIEALGPDGWAPLVGPTRS